MRILCLKHIAFEGPAAIALWALRRGHTLQIEPVYLNKPLPSPDTFDVLLVMGGPMSTYDDAKYPWLPKEKSYIRSSIAAGKHVIGICLGAQLIAHVLGAETTQAADKEIGWFPIERSTDCPEAIQLGQQLRVLHWHGETFAIPKGAQRIGHSEACDNQGFLYRNRVLALQCHLELTPESLALLIAACSNELVPGPYIQTAETMRAEPDQTYEHMHARLFEMLDNFLEQS